MITRTVLVTLAVVLTVGTSALHSQVPQLINYQGRIAVGTVNFDGSGQFKFALVNGTGSTTYWSNDGTSVAGSQPAAAVTLTVTKGLYSVLLGDATLPNMTVVPATVFTNADVRLRVWFNDGSSGPQLLTPDQRIAAVGYAMVAGNVPDGAITSAKIAPGAVGAAQLAPGAAVANLNASGQSGIASGGLVLYATESADLINAGYLPLGTTTTGDVWQQRVNGAAPVGRQFHTAVWTGSEMIVWGGVDASLSKLNTGGRFNPVANSWTPIGTIGAPIERSRHTAVWTGSEMIVWGGISGVEGDDDELNDGGRYDPASNSWTAVSAAGAPAARIHHTGVWTGSEMIIWGGTAGNGARYNPSADTWTGVNPVGAPASRRYHTAVWTGSEMIVWGGFSSGGLNSGGRYNATGNSWTAVSTTSAPSARWYHAAVWTGSEMIVWGGTGGSGGISGGGRYSPAANTWTTVSGGPSGRYYHTAVWVGGEMVVWGGNRNGTYLNDGAYYNLGGNNWTTVNTTGAPAARDHHTAVWTGSQMFIWGGYNGTDYLNDTYSYIPGRVMYLYQRP